MKDPIEILKESFEDVTDSRKAQGKQFNLQELLASSVLAILSGADDFTGMAEYCREKTDFLTVLFL